MPEPESWAKSLSAQAILPFSISRMSRDDMLPLVSAMKYTCFTVPSLKAIASRENSCPQG